MSVDLLAKQLQQFHFPLFSLWQQTPTLLPIPLKCYSLPSGYLPAAGKEHTILEGVISTAPLSPHQVDTQSPVGVAKDDNAMARSRHNSDNSIPTIPPGGYLCHLCFQKGHYIKDCSLVSSEHGCKHGSGNINVLHTVLSLNYQVHCWYHAS